MGTSISGRQQAEAMDSRNHAPKPAAGVQRLPRTPLGRWPCITAVWLRHQVYHGYPRDLRQYLRGYGTCFAVSRTKQNIWYVPPEEITATKRYGMLIAEERR